MTSSARRRTRDSSPASFHRSRLNNESERIAEVDVTIAVRRPDLTTAISPKTSPGPRDLTAAPSTVTSAVPSTITSTEAEVAITRQFDAGSLDVEVVGGSHEGQKVAVGHRA